LRALLADRAALMADFARLQVENTGLRHWRDIGQRAGRKLLAQRNAAEAREAAMRLLVEQVAAGDPYMMAFNGATYCRYCNRDRGYAHFTSCLAIQARALVATWQTPAAPTRLTDAEMTQRIVSVMMQDHPDGEEWHAIPIPPLGPIRNVSPDAAAPTPGSREGDDDA